MTKYSEAQPRIAVIGAGCSGLTSIKNLLQAKLTNIICYEQADQLGGNWVYTAKESHSSVCETTHIISSKKMSEFFDFPMPENYPDYPSHQQVLEYFQQYARHFGLEPYIRYRTPVLRVDKIEGQRWRLQLPNGEVDEVEHLLVANGHHAQPRHPELAGKFTGRYLHAHSFKNNRGFEDQRVLVIGAGNSGCDCAVEVSRVAAFTAISMRRPYYIIPKFIMGRPTDTFTKVLTYVPKFLRSPLQRLSLRLQIGRYKQYGLKEPDYPITATHPTLNSELLYKMRHGKVHPRTGIARIEGQQVWFDDGTQETYDSIIAATGYKIHFPFFDPAFIDYSDSERIPLYLRMFHPEHKSLYFIGLFEPTGCIWPLADLQAKLAVRHIAGHWKRPENIAELADADSDYIAREFASVKRHSIEVHYHPFRRRLEQALSS